MESVCAASWFLLKKKKKKAQAGNEWPSHKIFASEKKIHHHQRRSRTHWLPGPWGLAQRDHKAKTQVGLVTWAMCKLIFPFRSLTMVVLSIFIRTFFLLFFFPANLSSSGCSRFGSLFTNEEQKNVGSWRNINFRHTCRHCSWRHRHGQPDTSGQLSRPCLRDIEKTITRLKNVSSHEKNKKTKNQFLLIGLVTMTRFVQGGLRGKILDVCLCS